MSGFRELFFSKKLFVIRAPNTPKINPLIKTIEFLENSFFLHAIDLSIEFLLIGGA
jgi:hypothetical protein